MTSPPPAIGAASAGLRYQVRAFWLRALPMLYEDHITKVVVEHRAITAVDDIVIYYAPPGINEGGSRIEVDFLQIKFHVKQSGTVDEESVLDPAWTGTTECLLKRFCDAWQKIRATHPSARLSLITNWPWDTASPVRSHIRDAGHLDDAFFTKGPGSKVGKIRARWQAACGLEDADFCAFVRALRFSTSSVSLGQAEEWLRDRCRSAGLVPIDPALDWSPYDDLGKRLIEGGRTEHTPESLHKLVSDQKLTVAESPSFRSTCAVRSFRRFAHAPAADGACLVDLTDLFDERRAIDEGSWAGRIRQRLEAAVPAIEALAQPVQIALDTHLSIAWFAGSLLNPKSGIPVMLRQQVKGKGTQLWDVSTPHCPDGAAEWSCSAEKHRDGTELAVVVSVTHDGLEDATRFISRSLPAVGTTLHLKLDAAGPAAVVDGGHARWLADELVRSVRNEAAAATPMRIHVFAAAPASLMFLVGQEAGALGPTTVYEFSFGSAERTYQPGMAT